MTRIQAEKNDDSTGIDRPIFILAPHRSGTTLLYRILAEHPGLGYFNQTNRRLRGFPRLAHLVTRVRGEDKPAEAQKIWDRFRSSNDDVMGTVEATPEAIKWYRHQIRTILTLRKAGRFIAKYPRLSLRMSWIDTIFPGAVFLHMRRDWRAVVSSTVIRKEKRQDKNGGWFGVRVPAWKEMADLPHEVAAGRIFRMVTETIEAEGAKYGARFIQTSYESLCATPLETTRDLVSQCGLDWTPAFERTIPTDLRNANYKWREHLDEKMIARIRAEDPDFYARFEHTD